MKKVFSVLIIVLLSTIIVSCSKDFNIKSIDDGSIAKQLDFKELVVPFEGNSLAKRRFIIVGWDEWGRKRRNCDGWGLCNAQWFYWEDDGSRVSGDLVYQTPLEYDDELKTYYIEILLDAPTDLPEEELTLPIDEGFIIDTAEAIGKDLTFNQGEYPFDRNLGEFGGIRIDLE